MDLSLCLNPIEETGSNKRFRKEGKFACDLCPNTYTILLRFNRHKSDHTNGKVFKLKSKQPAERPVLKDLQCNICKKSMTSSHKMARHKRAHSEATLKCNFCDKKCRERRDMIVHERRHTGEKPFSCALCGKSFADIRAMRFHEKTHTGEKPHECVICGMNFLQSGTLLVHKTTVHNTSEEMPFVCIECDKRFKLKWYLKKHMDGHLKNLLHQCTICQFQTKFLGNLSSHKRNMHEKNIKYNCKECGLALASKYSVKQHVEARHLGYKANQCPLCDYKTASKSTLRDHVRYVHEKLKIGCSLCSWEGRRKSLSSHKRAVHALVLGNNIKEHKCEICDKVYLGKENLKKHKGNVHSGVRYQCVKCDYLSSTKGSLRRHTRSTHEGVKSPCPQCDHKAHDQPSLAKHIKVVHLGLKPFKCQACDFRSTTESNILNHEKRRHSSEKSHFCLFCNKGFLQLTNLSIHERTHTGQKTINCPQCDTLFSTKWFLEKHIKSH